MTGLGDKLAAGVRDAREQQDDTATSKSSTEASKATTKAPAKRAATPRRTASRKPAGSRSSSADNSMRTGLEASQPLFPKRIWPD